MPKVGGFEYKKSTNPAKKLMVVVERGGKKKNDTLWCSFYGSLQR